MKIVWRVYPTELKYIYLTRVTPDHGIFHMEERLLFWDKQLFLHESYNKYIYKTTYKGGCIMYNM